jgi:DNA replication and repair protein RecF
MKFREVQLQTFRNHAATEFECAPGRNVFFGNNGEGKTNILEAISYLCLTKSFYASSDSTAVQFGETGFTVSANAVSDIEVAYRIDVSYIKEAKEKRIAINNGVVDDRPSIIGMFPVVVLSPENANVTSGTPADRRRFIDVVVSQSNKSYLQDLLEYRRILRQRNRILFEAKAGQRVSPDLMEPWNENLVKRGSQITQRRAEFVHEFSPYLVDAYTMIAGSEERPSMKYGSSIKVEAMLPTEQIQSLFRRELEQQRAEEQKLGTTLVGPHKDELEFEINGMGLKAFASQGQHKTFLVALKIAEFYYLQERCRETPILLLDDVFSELDEPRSAKLLTLTANLGQTFITATDEHRFTSVVNRGNGMAKYHVCKGKVTFAKPETFRN